MPQRRYEFRHVDVTRERWFTPPIELTSIEPPPNHFSFQSEAAGSVDLDTNLTFHFMAANGYEFKPLAGSPTAATAGFVQEVTITGRPAKLAAIIDTPHSSTNPVYANLIFIIGQKPA